MIDEIEKGLAYTGSGDADAGLSRRIFGRLLSWLQDREAPVFVVGTRNQVAQLPAELMRKGRFDEVFFIDLSAHLLGELRATRPLAAIRREEVDALRRWAHSRTVLAS